MAYFRLFIHVLILLVAISCSRDGNSSNGAPGEPIPEPPSDEPSGTSGSIEGICPSPEIVQRTVKEGPPPSSVPRSLADSCPGKFTDGNDKTIDISILSCHSVAVECSEGESALDCGKKSLESGDWEMALEQFSTQEAIVQDRCEATYGRFLARLFRNYANANHIFFDDVVEPNFNRHKRKRTLYMPTSNWGHTFHQHFDCLNRPSFYDLTSKQTYLEEDLAYIWENNCSLSASDGGPLPIRFVEGKCSDPLSDIVLVGKWDKVDATFIYSFGFSNNPPVTLRATVANLYSGPNQGACPSDSPICDPLILESAEGVEEVEIPRLPRDAEEYLALLHRTLEEFSNPKRDPDVVFAYRDADGDGRQSLGDEAIIRACEPATGEPVFDFSNAKLGGVYPVAKAPPPENPAERKIEIFCGSYHAKGEECPLFEGETALNEFPPIPIPNEFSLSPDGSQLAFMLEVGGGFHHIYITETAGPEVYGFALDEKKAEVSGSSDDFSFAPANRQAPTVYVDVDDSDDEKSWIGQYKPLCHGNESLDECCVTCNAWPEGFQTGLFENQPNLGLLPQWIKDSHGEPIGLFFMANDHPSSWGWQGQAQGAQFYAIKVDGTGLSPLLPETMPTSATNFQAHVSPDGQNLFWTSTWNPQSNKIGVNTLLLGDLKYDPTQSSPFRLENIRYALPSLDHGLAEANGFAINWPENRSILYTSSPHSKSSLRTFMYNIETGVAFKLNHPTEERDLSQFLTDNHPAWYEHAKCLDDCRQIFFISTQGNPEYSNRNRHFGERFDQFLTFPPIYDATSLGVTLVEIRFLSALGYYTEDFTPYYIRYWLSHIDGSHLDLITGQAPEQAGWITHSVGIHNGEIYFIQSRGKKGDLCRFALSPNRCDRRFGVVRFPR